MLFEPAPPSLADATYAGERKLSRKEAGAYYTPDAVVRTLVQWAVRNPTDRLLDPSCGDGRFVALHPNSFGCEQDADSVREVHRRAPHAQVHQGDFFAWAASTRDRFDCAVGNPPFIRYQSFKGDRRKNALTLCRTLGANFSGLASSWAPFLVATASLLVPGGRMAFVVPAEIGHAPYAAPLLDYLARNFAVIHVLAYREKIFPDLSEDCWLLYADGFGESASEIRFTSADLFEPLPRPPSWHVSVDVREWRHIWNCRLRPFLMPMAARELYREVSTDPGTRRLGDLATVGIGYVTGANDFFHLRPSEAERWSIPQTYLVPSVRNGRVLPLERLTVSVVEEWHRRDEAMLLLNIPRTAELPGPVRRYLETERAALARQAFKCRVRDPWYSVPDVQTPDFFLSYMSGVEPSLVRNDAGCTCTNSVHGVRLKPTTGRDINLLDAWRSPIVRLSCELEGHPLGGGMLKLEPREAARIILPNPVSHAQSDIGLVGQATATLRRWRHYADGG